MAELDMLRGKILELKRKRDDLNGKAASNR